MLPCMTLISKEWRIGTIVEELDTYSYTPTTSKIERSKAFSTRTKLRKLLFSSFNSVAYSNDILATSCSVQCQKRHANHNLNHNSCLHLCWVGDQTYFVKYCLGYKIGIRKNNSKIFIKSGSYNFIKTLNKIKD